MQERKKEESKSVKRRKAISKKTLKNNTVDRKDVKYCVTFLKGQLFRGVWQEKGSTIELPENDAKAYAKRAIKIERLA